MSGTVHARHRTFGDHVAAVPLVAACLAAEVLYVALLLFTERVGFSFAWSVGLYFGFGLAAMAAMLHDEWRKSLPDEWWLLDRNELIWPPIFWLVWPFTAVVFLVEAKNRRHRTRTDRRA